MNRYENVTIPESLKNHFTKVLVVLLQVFAYSIKTIRTGTRDRIKRLVQNAVRGSDEVVPQLVTKLDKLSKDEGLIKATETLLNTQKLIEGQEKTDQDLQGIKKALDGISSAAHIQSSSEKHLENAKIIIKPSISTGDIFQTMKNKLVDGTGAWVRDQHVFKDWLEEKSTTLCITGSPGFGKSFIAASIILYLQKEILQDTPDSDGSVAFFFFRDNNPETRKIDQCLRDLTYQIYRNDLAFQAYFNSHFSSEKDLESPESIWREIFQAYFLQHKEAKKVYLVLDGLDEAFEEDQQTLFSILGPDMALGMSRTFPKINRSPI